MDWMNKENLFKSKDNIIDLSCEDPENIYISKYFIEKKIKEENPNYQKKTLQKFINDLDLSTHIYVSGTDTIPFKSYYDTLFITTTNEVQKKILLNGLESIQYDLSKLKKHDILKQIENDDPRPFDYFIINGIMMVY